MELDIIIPCYNAKNTLFKTLSSIAIQRDIEKVSVTLVNDCSKYDYQEEVDYFSRFFQIQEIKTLKNGGPGDARNLGIQSTHNPYIVFIDSDDYLYTPVAISHLLGMIHQDNIDVGVSSFIYERDQERLIKNQDLTWLHGKIFKRDFLEKHSILFPSSRANEDNGFNRLVQLMNAHYLYSPEITYVYSENQDSITRKDNRSFKYHGLEGYCQNMMWAIQEAQKRGGNREGMSLLSLGVLNAMYHYYLELSKEYDPTNLLKWSKPICEYYDLHSERISSQQILDFIAFKDHEYQERGIVLEKTISFDEFLDNVRKCSYD